ncbi:hypothetical protein NLM59_00945 [Weeksellaceae bacterium KMM 9724]|uniref:hypothetical protein n=1 Tax=Profundicola chukchiensis TaxID=2961959 RepID=UPI00243BE9A4|nr:hypothetical protein [Profundicola chukchiensis]MDG4949478.1 hypothetical protein [Profundicola chukchiensis]
MKLSRILMIVSALLLLALFVFPLWSITLEAPQYPRPLSMDIFIYKFQDYNPDDIKNINLMNHYVGMKFIPETIPEFVIFPIVIGIMSLAGVLIGAFKNYKWFLGWFILMVLLATAGMIDFYIWERNYGNDLDPNAIMKFTDEDGNPMGFQPPFYGSKQILNFIAHSYPGIGAFIMGAGIALSLVAYFLGKKELAQNNY